jgi:hypothetical protein
MVITCKLSLGFQKKEVLNLSARGGSTASAATKDRPKMQQKQGVDHKQPVDSCEWNNEECQLTLRVWTELSIVPSSTWLSNYCSYSK